MNIAILTSGGDAPGMNAFISNFVKLATKKKDSVFAFKFGYQGVVDNELVLLTQKDVDNIRIILPHYIVKRNSTN